MVRRKRTCMPSRRGCSISTDERASASANHLQIHGFLIHYPLSPPSGHNTRLLYDPHDQPLILCLPFVFLSVIQCTHCDILTALLSSSSPTHATRNKTSCTKSEKRPLSLSLGPFALPLSPCVLFFLPSSTKKNPSLFVVLLTFQKFGAK